MDIKRIKKHAEAYYLEPIKYLREVQVEDFVVDEDSILFADCSRYYLLMPDMSKHQHEKALMECIGRMFWESKFRIIEAHKFSTPLYQRIALVGDPGPGWLTWSFESGNKFDAELNLYVLYRTLVDDESETVTEHEPAPVSSSGDQSEAPSKADDDAERMAYLDRAAMTFLHWYMVNINIPVGVDYPQKNKDLAYSAYTVAKSMWEARQALFFKVES